jgi:Family of unknown function (DUF6522)
MIPLGFAKAYEGRPVLSQPVIVMHEVEIQDGVMQIDAGIIGRDLGLEPFEVRRLMHEGKLTSRCERGVDEDAGRYRLTFFHENRRLRLITDRAGRIIRRSLIDFGDRPPAARLHTRGS